MNRRDFPWRNQFDSLYHVFMSKSFLAQTRVVVVTRVIPECLTEFLNIPSLRKAAKDKIAEVIRSTGFQNQRDIFENSQELQALPHVGQYVANATLCFDLNQPPPIIDTDIERISCRLLGGNWLLGDVNHLDIIGSLAPLDRTRRCNLPLLTLEQGYAPYSHSTVKDVLRIATNRTTMKENRIDMVLKIIESFTLEVIP